MRGPVQPSGSKAGVAVPEPDRIGQGIAFVLAAVAALTVMDSAVKWLGAGYPIAEIVFFRTVIAMGLIGGCRHYLMVQAYRRAPVAVLAPFDYIALPLGALLGWLIWSELPDTTVWLGAAIIIASGWAVVRREASGARR